jgi:hypothetical protein
MADSTMQGAEQGAATGAAFGPWGAVIGGVAGAFLGGGGSDAAQQQQQQNQQAQLDWNKQQDPFSAGGNRGQYVPQLNQLMQGGPAGVSNDPMFQKMNQQSMDQVQRREQASGQGGSGQEMMALQNQGFGNQMDYFNQQYSRLSDLSGASRGGGQAAMGQSPGAAYEQRMGQYANQGSGFGMMMGGLTDIFGKGFGSGGGSSYGQQQQGQQGGGLWNGPQGTDPATGMA